MSEYSRGFADGFNSRADMKGDAESEVKKIHEQTAALEERNARLAAQMERVFAIQARRNYQIEIHGVAINVLAALLTKDALRAVRDEGYSQMPAINVEQVVDFSLIVGKRYVDEMHRIQVSDKQIAEYKEFVQLSQPGQPESIDGIVSSAAVDFHSNTK